MLTWRHLFIGPAKIEMSVGHVGRIWAVPNSPRNRKRLNKVLAMKAINVRLCEDGTTLVTVSKELKPIVRVCEECGACLSENDWPEGETCPVCNPY